MAKRTNIGGSFAPPLTEELLERYRATIDAMPAGALRDAVDALHRCAAAWWEQPESTGDGRPHASGKGVIVDLDEPIVAALDPTTPWAYECDAIQALLDASTITGEARHAAYHLLWFAKELTQDREPITADKVK